MVEESSPLLPPAEESIEAETDTAVAPEPESRKPTPESTREPSFVCDCGEWMRSACKGLPSYKQHENKRYCVLHYPGKEKAVEFKAALDKKLNDKAFDFRGVWFPEQISFRDFDFSADTFFMSATFSAHADFSFATFSKDVSFSSATFIVAVSFIEAKFSAGTNFLYATFSAAVNFMNASFSADAQFGSATFSADAYFTSATFSADAYFSAAKFSVDAYFSAATFSADADFSLATFSTDVHFNESLFHATASFTEASFKGSVRFFGTATERELKDGARLAAMALGNDPSLDFQHVRVERPDRIAFHTLILRPHWFVNIDSRQFVFTDVGWEWERISIKQEIAALEAENVESPNRLLAIACRQLAENAETNNRYEEASRFRYWAMDLARMTKWNGWSFWKTDWLHMLYWAVSGYGERILRALGVLAAVWFVFVLLYTQVCFVQQPLSNQAASSATAAPIMIEDRIGQPLEFSRALTYSLGVMSLQKPEPKPLTGTAQTLVLLETILGPVQAALLALAIRRKFMR